MGRGGGSEERGERIRKNGLKVRKMEEVDFLYNSFFSSREREGVGVGEGTQFFSLLELELKIELFVFFLERNGKMKIQLYTKGALSFF